MVPYIIRFLLLYLLALPPYLLLRRPWRHPGRREAVLGCFCLYLWALLCLALAGHWQPPAQMLQEALRRLSSGDSINLVPFHTISSFFRYLSFDDFLVNICGNVLIFVPWGFGLVLLWKPCRSPFRLTVLCLLPSVTIEFLQLFIGRHVDVDDLILNFTGGLLGTLCWFGLRRRFPVLDTFSSR